MDLMVFLLVYLLHVVTISLLGKNLRVYRADASRVELDCHPSVPCSDGTLCHLPDPRYTHTRTRTHTHYLFYVFHLYYLHFVFFSLCLCLWVSSGGSALPRYLHHPIHEDVLVQRHQQVVQRDQTGQSQKTDALKLL